MTTHARTPSPETGEKAIRLFRVDDHSVLDISLPRQDGVETGRWFQIALPRARILIGIKTVETYKTRGMLKLELDSRGALTRYALQHG